MRGRWDLIYSSCSSVYEVRHFVICFAWSVVSQEIKMCNVNQSWARTSKPMSQKKSLFLFVCRYGVRGGWVGFIIVILIWPVPRLNWMPRSESSAYLLPTSLLVCLILTLPMSFSDTISRMFFLFMGTCSLYLPLSVNSPALPHLFNSCCFPPFPGAQVTFWHFTFVIYLFINNNNYLFILADYNLVGIFGRKSAVSIVLVALSVGTGTLSVTQWVHYG